MSERMNRIRNMFLVIISEEGELLGAPKCVEIKTRWTPFDCLPHHSDRVYRSSDVMGCGVMSWQSLLASGHSGAVSVELCAPLSCMLDWDASLSVMILTLKGSGSRQDSPVCQAQISNAGRAPSPSPRAPVTNTFKRPTLASPPPQHGVPGRLSQFTSLPHDLHAAIASFLPPYDTLRTAAVCRKLRVGFVVHVHTVSLWPSNFYGDSEELRRQRCVGVCALLSGIGTGLKEVRVRAENGMAAVGEALVAGHGRAIETIDMTDDDYASASSMLTFLAEHMRNGRLELLRCVKLMQLGDRTANTLIANALAEGRCSHLETLLVDDADQVGMDASLWARAFELRDAVVGGCRSLRHLRLILSDDGPTEAGLRAMLETHTCSALEDLHLTFIDSSGDIIAPIAEYLGSARAASLQRLSIALDPDVHIVYPSWALVWVALSSRGTVCGLRELRLTGGEMREEGCVALGEAIDAGALERVEVIDVREVEFGLRAWKAEMRRVRRYTCEALNEIHVQSEYGYNKVTDVICTAIERARRKGMFPNLRVIERVDGSDCNAFDVDVTDTESEGGGALGQGENESDD